MTRVLFLGGLGRSGTTLVERLLGELPTACAVGETVHLWERGLVAGERCGCGASFHDCGFWGEVGRVAFDGWHALDPGRVRALKASVDRTRNIPALARSRLPAGLAASVRAYGDLYARLYAAVRQVSGCDVVIDSSKHASLAFCLRWHPDVDLRVLHVVRDSRGVAYSWTKAVRRPESPDRDRETYMARFSPARAAAHWTAQNLAFHLLGRCGTPTRLMRYERVPADPVAAVRAAAALSGFPCEGSLGFLSGQGALLGPCHTVSGNPMRFETGRVALRVDDAWRSRLPTLDRGLVTALTLPLLARYGYLGPLEAGAGDPPGDRRCQRTRTTKSN
ncbi:MAG: sulfotransferase [Streptosporangiaceae bacterium]